MSKMHSKYPVEAGEPYAELPFTTDGAPRGEAYLDVTAEMAAGFLGHSKGGRRIRDSRVEELAREMRAGEYSAAIRGKPFKFDNEGYLRDGHHTAYAVIEAAKDDAENKVPGIGTVPAGVIWGLTEAEVMQLDIIATRTYADTLHVARVPNAGELAPLVRASISWDHGFRSDRTHYQPTPAELADRLTRDEVAFTEAISKAQPILSTLGHRGVYSPSALRFHLYLLVRLGLPEASLLKWVNALTYDSDPWVRRNITDVFTDARVAISRSAPFRRYPYQLGLLNEGWNRFSRGDMRGKIALKILAERISEKDDFPVPKA